MPGGYHRGFPSMHCPVGRGETKTRTKGAGMAGALDGKRIAFLCTEGVEQVELTRPMDAVREAGGQPQLISLEQGPFTAFNHLDKADEFDAELAVADADATEYDGL